MENDTVMGCLAVLAIAFLIGLLFLIPAIHLSSVGTGSHSGYVTAIDYYGLFFPNYMVYFKTDNSSSQEDQYCVSRDNKELADKLKGVNVTKQRVTLFYHGVRAIGYGLCEYDQIDKFEIDR